MDMCVPESNQRAYGPYMSQRLAYLDTNLAMHNGDNYAGFVIEASLTVSSRMPKLALEEVERAIIQRPRRKIRALSSMLASFEAFPTVAATALPSMKAAPEGLTRGEQEFVRHCS